MASSPPGVAESGLEVDWHRQQDESQGLQKHEPVNGLQHLAGHYPDAVAVSYPGYHPRRILGLSIGMFWLAIAVIVLILAGGIGGGVAGGLAAQKNSCPQAQTSSTTSSTPLTPLTASTASTSPTSASTSPTSASSSTASSTISAATGSPSPQIFTPCTTSLSNNGTTLIAADASGSNAIIGSKPHSFLLLCNTNYPAGSIFGNPNLIDLLLLYTPDMAGCITACVEYNTGYAVRSGGPKCAAVGVVKTPGAFCFLKSAMGVNNTSTSEGAPIDSAILIE